MKAIRAEIQTLTSSFRYGMFAVAHQPTYHVPPLSTILGLLSAAKGKKVTVYDMYVGFDFTFKGTGIDLEKIYEWGGETKSSPPVFQKNNILNRDFLFDCLLTLYISDLSFKEYLKHPYYSILLGRQTDLAYIKSIKEVELISQEVEINNTIIPFDGKVPGQIVALPSDYTDEASRKAVEVKPYCILTSMQKIQGYYDPELNKGVYMHAFSKK